MIDVYSVLIINDVVVFGLFVVILGFIFKIFYSNNVVC